jgi:hypothetical protein
MWWLVGAMTTALAAWECEPIGMDDVMAVTRVVNKLSKRFPTTLALEAVRQERQSALDRYARGEMAAMDLPEALQWEDAWGFPYEPYRGLVTAADRGVQVVAVGLENQAAPDHVDFPVPAGYMAILRDAMAGHEMPLAMQSRFVRSMAWLDHQMAETALQAWDGQGYLVIVVGRGHVENREGGPRVRARLGW